MKHPEKDTKMDVEMEKKGLEELGSRGFRLMQDLIAEEYPYLTPLLFILRGKPDWSEGSMSTDGNTAFYNPRYVVESLGKRTSGYEKMKRCYLQMIAHCLLGHIWKKPPGEDVLWECCCDVEAELLASDIVAENSRRRETQAIQKLIRKLKAENAEGLFVLAGQEGCREDIEKMGRKARRDAHERWEKERERLEQREQESVQGGFNAGFKMWKSFWQRIFSTFPANVRECVAAGLLPGSSLELITASEENESDYRRILRRYSTLKEKKMEDFDAIDGCWYALGMELYGNIPLIEYPETSERQNVDDIVIAIDVSGSCSGETASRFLRETCNMIRDMGIGRETVNIRILECDTQIQRETVIHSEEDIPDFEVREMVGFGGTSFVPVFRHIDELLESGELHEVRCLLYLSDGLGDFPEQEPDYDVIYVLDGTKPGVAGYGGVGLSDTGFDDERLDEIMPVWVRQVRLTEKDLTGEW